MPHAAPEIEVHPHASTRASPLARLAALACLLLLLSFGLCTAYVAVFGLRASEVPSSSRFELELAVLRGLAESRPGPLPVQLHAHTLAEESQSRGAAIAGESWRDAVERGYTAFEVIYADRSIMIDAPSPRSATSEVRIAFARRLHAADRILLSSTHSDHVRGISAFSSGDELADKLDLNAAQRREIESRSQLDWSDRLPERSPLQNDRSSAVEPGLVVIPAPGVTPGSQLVFVRLQDGREFLLVGDVVWSSENLRLLRGRPHLIARFLLGEDEAAVADQIRALHDLDPSGNLSILPSHDADELQRQSERGNLIWIRARTR